MKRLLIFVTFGVWFISLSIYAQETILSVSSFRPCVSVDSRYISPSTANNGSTLINCTTNTDTLPQITVVDLRLNPGIGAPSSLLFNLTVVQGNQNGAGSVPATSSSECQLSDPAIQTCVLTTPAVVNVESTKIVYRYRLVPAEVEVPYCYGSVTIFEQYLNAFQKCQDLCDGSIYNCEAFTGCIPVQYAADSLMAMLNKKANILTQQANTDQFKLNSFMRVQRPVMFSPMQCINFNTPPQSTVQDVLEYGDMCNDVSNQPSANRNPNVIAYKQGNLRNITNGWFLDGYFNRDFCAFQPPTPPPSSNACRQSTSTNPAINYDNSNVDVRIPAFMPNPSIHGMTPSPIYRNLITSPVTSADDINLPVNITSLSLDLGSVGYACAGFDCPNNQDVRRIEQRTFTDPESGSTITEWFSTSYFNTMNSIVSLGPKCYLYYITPEPEVFSEITIDVTANGHTEQLVIDNFNPAGSSTSAPYRYVFGRIENIQTPNGIIGPSIQGALLFCGQESDIQFINMQCLIEGVNCNSDQTVDLSSSPGFSETTNPWDTIMKTSLNQNGFQERTNFFPHPYDYIIPSDANGKDANAKSIPNDHGQSFWYFVDDKTLINQFGVDCNTIGMAQGVNAAQQNANLFCNLDPHSCLPGLGPIANGGLKDALPCKVSQYMNFASGFYDKTVIPFPYGNGNAAESAQFIQYMKNNATRFMPNNPFVQPGNNGSLGSLYDPTNPQWWVGYGGPNSGGQFLYYSPSTTDGVDYNTNIAVELVLDIVGTFVGYEASVSKGEIQKTLSTCTFVQGQNSQLSIYVDNPSLEGVGVTTSYIITVDCNPPGQDPGFVMDVIPGSQQVTLAPGEHKYVNFTTSASSGNPTADQVSCIATMLYADVVVNASCDQEVINCGITIELPSGQYSLGAPTPPPPGGDTFNCTGFCSLTCYIDAGTPWQSGCYWLIVVGLSLLGLALIITVITASYYYFYRVGQTETSVNRTNKFIESEEKKSKEIIEAPLE